MSYAAHDVADDARWDVIWNLLVLAACALLLLPIARWMLLWRITRALAVLWVVLLAASWLLRRVQKALRVEDDPPSDAYLLSNAALGVVLLTGWAGYAALLVRDAAQGTPAWMAAMLYLAGFLASHAAFTTVSILYRGSFYRMANVIVALGGYLLFAAWPAAARALVGWLA